MDPQGTGSYMDSIQEPVVGFARPRRPSWCQPDHRILFPPQPPPPPSSPTDPPASYLMFLKLYSVVVCCLLSCNLISRVVGLRYRTTTNTVSVCWGSRTAYPTPMSSRRFHHRRDTRDREAPDPLLGSL